MHNFGYLIAKILAADFVEDPFRHVYIEDFFDPQHFREIVTSPEVALRQTRDDQDLLHVLHDAGYEAITFPGTTTNLKEYVRWHKERDPKGHTNVETCEGFGVTLRLNRYQPESALGQLNTFFNSADFLVALHSKFSLDSTKTYVDNGLQKYLDGYEISPHPDIRSKALTYMININPAPASESIEFHTHYLRFTPQRDYVRQYWRGNPDFDRCWVPWDWCETIKIQRKNNSIVVFSPSDDTLHAVRAAYNHLETQRTQFYGNLWYRTVELQGKPSWRDYEIGCTPEVPARKLSSLVRMNQELKRMVRPSVARLLRRRHAARQ
jgi:hypothetical protein